MVSLKCFWIKRQLAPYLDGALAEDRARAVAAHLQRCAGCRVEVSQLERLRGLLRAALTVGPDPDWTGFWEGVRGRLVAERPKPWRNAWAWYPRLALGGALAGLLVLAGVLSQSGHREVLLAPPGVVVSGVETEDPDRNVLVFSSPEDEMTVIWVFGPDQPTDQS